jgi:hypothetical protein
MGEADGDEIAKTPIAFGERLPIRHSKRSMINLNLSKHAKPHSGKKIHFRR